VRQEPRVRRRREKTRGSAAGVVMRTSQWSKSRVFVEGGVWERVGSGTSANAQYIHMFERERERERDRKSVQRTLRRVSEGLHAFSEWGKWRSIVHPSVP